jgi:hypothetical protein
MFNRFLLPEKRVYVFRGFGKAALGMNGERVTEDWFN